MAIEPQPKMILHLAPKHVDIRPGQGSHKDVAARRAFFAATGVNYRYANVGGDNPAELAGILNQCAPSHVLIEYSYFPNIAKAIRRQFGSAFIATRAHNIEPLQEWSLSEFASPVQLMRDIYTVLRLLTADIRMARIVDHVYVIAPSEARRYWRRLGVGAKVSWLPYMPPIVMTQSERGTRRDVIACLPGGAPSRRTRDLVNRFARFAQAAKDSGWTERFVMTGDIGGWNVRLNASVELVGYVEDLQSFYRNVKAVAILSPIGHGFKTTIADAIWSGAKVLVHPAIGSELPEELGPHCVMLDTLGPAELARARSSLHVPLPDAAAPEAFAHRFGLEMARFMQGTHRVTAA